MGPSGQTPDPQLPQPAGDRGGQGPGAEAFQLGQRRAELRLLVAVGEGGGGLIGAAEGPPAVGRGVQVAGHLQGERLGGVREPDGREPVGSAQPPQPEGKLAGRPGVALGPLGQVERVLHHRPGRGRIASEPGRLGPGGRHWTEPL
jgi:hypothetical protein